MTSEHPLCADRCTLLDDYIASQSANELEHRAKRLALGLTPEFVPPIPRAPTAAALRWLHDDQFTD